MHLPCLVDFVNHHARTFRAMDGGLSALGRRVAALGAARFNASGAENECARVDGSTLTRASFLRDFVGRSRPVVIYNATDGWAARTAWSNDALRAQFGGREVRLFA